MLRSDPLQVRVTRMLIARRIAEARIDAGFTQAEVAKALERGQGWVSETEAGQRRVEAAELFAFAEVLGKPAGWFVRPPADRERAWTTEYRESLRGNQKRLARTPKNELDDVPDD